METLQSFCNSLINQMEGDLLKIRLEHPPVFSWSKASIPYLQECVSKLKTFITDRPFKKRSEEIWFFKEIKPVVMGRLIFMCEVYNKEAFRPLSSRDDEKLYLRREMGVVDTFLNNHRDLYNYYKDGEENLDVKFFVREVEDRFNFRELPIEIDPVLFYGDPGFSTGFDYLFAQFRGYGLLRAHLESELETIFLVGNEVQPEGLQFTGSRADFVEMVHLFKTFATPMNPETGQPLSDEELFQLLKQDFNPELPDGVDFAMLKLISGNSDLQERMLDEMDDLHKKWDDEQKDINYDDE